MTAKTIYPLLSYLGLFCINARSRSKHPTHRLCFKLIRCSTTSTAATSIIYSTDSRWQELVQETAPVKPCTLAVLRFTRSPHRTLLRSFPDNYFASQFLLLMFQPWLVSAIHQDLRFRFKMDLNALSLLARASTHPYPRALPNKRPASLYFRHCRFATRYGPDCNQDMMSLGSGRG